MLDARYRELQQRPVHSMHLGPARQEIQPERIPLTLKRSNFVRAKPLDSSRTAIRLKRTPSVVANELAKAKPSQPIKAGKVQS